MNRRLSVILSVLLLAASALASEPPAERIRQLGFLPRGTAIPELSTPEATHYSNGDGTIRAVITARARDEFGVGTDEWTPITDPVRSGYVWQWRGDLIYGWSLTVMKCGKETGGTDSLMDRAFAEWSTSSIQDGSVINSVRCSTYCSTYPPFPMPSQVPIWQMSGRPSALPTDPPPSQMALRDLFIDCGSGVQYGTYSTPAPGWLVTDLDPQASTDLQNQLADDWFAVGYDCDGTGQNRVIGFSQSSGTRPTLIVDYYESGAPPKPTPELPANGGTVTVFRPTLQVAAVSGADQYEFRVFQGATQLKDVTNSGRSWMLDDDLTHLSTYTWDCRAHNSVGWGPYFSPRWSFTVQIPVPSAPTLLSPANNSYVRVLRPTLTVSPVSGADLYWFRVFLAGTGTLVAEYNAGGAASWTLPLNLTDEQAYDWDCAAHNVAGWGSFSSRWTFNVLLPPDPPAPVSPANGAYVTDLAPTLQVGAVPGATSYQFRVYQGGSLVRSGTSSGVTWQVPSPPLTNNTAYTWDCRAVNAGGEGNYFTPPWGFTVLQLPVAPTALLPLNGDSVATLTPFLRVNAVPTAMLYHFRVYDQTGSVLIVEDAAVATNQWTVPGSYLADNTVYAWDCRAYNASGWGQFLTPRRTFRTDVAPPPTTYLRAPTPDSSAVWTPNLTPILRVHQIMGATQYVFQVFDDAGNPVTSGTAADSLWTVGTSLVEGGFYRWNCVVSNGGGPGPWSPLWRFSIIFAPVLNLPANGAIVTTVRPTLEVLAKSYATQYEFRVFQGVTLIRAGVVNSNSWTLDVDLTSGLTYTWDCRVATAKGWGPRSGTRTFSVWLPPAAPQANAPGNGATVATLTPELRVNAIAGCTQYEFRVFDDLGNPVTSGTSATNSWAVTGGPLQYGQTYHWDARARNPGGWGPFFDPRWAFTVSQTPPAPALAEPLDGAVVYAASPTLHAYKVSGATTYQFRVLEGGSEVRLLSAGDTFVTVNPPLEDGHTYEWECRVSNGFWGPYSSRWDFTVSLYPAAPSPVTPENGGNVLTLRPELVVAAVSGATWYHFQLYDSQTDALVCEDSATVPNWQVGAILTIGRTYWWQCRVRNSAGWGPFFDPRWSFTVARPWQPGWQELTTPVPSSPSGKDVKDGGWLVALGSQVYVAKGNKTGDFYRYDIADTLWYALESIPSDEGGRAKLPKKGCAAVGDGERFIYMTKGNNTLGFWKYDTESDSWSRQPDVPLGAGKKVKGGDDLGYVEVNDTGWVYLMKGYSTEFYRYNVLTRAWDTLDPVPYGIAPKYNMGSFLAYDGNGTVYAHQAKYTDVAKTRHYMFRYDVLAQSWLTETGPRGMPVLGMDGGKMKLKKSKDGGAGVWHDGFLYALKGGNTCQFYRYEPMGDSWSELDTIKSFGSTLKKKKVKAGGDITYSSLGAFYALKGNKTREVWRYVLPGAQAQAQAQARDGVMAGKFEVRTSKFEVTPNPLSGGWATLRYSLPKPGPVNVRICDALGRMVVSRAYGIQRMASSVPIDLRSLSAGVYLVRLDSDGFSTSQKLVVQR